MTATQTCECGAPLDGRHRLCDACSERVNWEAREKLKSGPPPDWYNDPILPTVRRAARARQPLDGRGAEAIEHALTITERERDKLQKLCEDSGALPLRTEEDRARMKQKVNDELERRRQIMLITSEIAKKREPRELAKLVADNTVVAVQELPTASRFAFFDELAHFMANSADEVRASTLDEEPS